jgi:hypothetical protein
MGNVPFYEEVVEFAKGIVDELNRRRVDTDDLPEYGIAAEHAHRFDLPQLSITIAVVFSLPEPHYAATISGSLTLIIHDSLSYWNQESRLVRQIISPRLRDGHTLATADSTPKMSESREIRKRIKRRRRQHYVEDLNKLEDE